MGRNKTYKIASGGVQGGYQGAKYQIKLLQLFSIRALKNKFDFEIWTEDEAADKFDDLLFSYICGSETRFSFLQAKNKVKQKTFELSTLFNDKNYDLYKYYKSFEVIEHNFKIDHKRSHIDDLIISTNNIISSTNDKTFTLTETTPDGVSKLHFERFENHEMLKYEGKLIKFDKSKETENCEFLKLKFLSIELAKLLFDPNYKTFFIQHSMDFLYLIVFEITKRSVNFKFRFLNQPTKQMKYFRQLLINAIKTERNMKDFSLDDFLQFCINFRFSRSLIDKILSFDSNPTLIDAQIKRFMSKFLFATEIDETSLNRSISVEILCLFNDSSELNEALGFCDKYFDDWLCGKRVDGVNDTREKLDQLDIVDVFAPMLTKSIKSLTYEFNSFPQDLKDFFDSFTSRTLIYQVLVGETFWGFLKVYSLNNKVIHLNINNANYQKILEACENSTRDFCVVVEATGRLDFLKEFMEKFERTCDAKLVVVCEEKIGKSLNGDTKVVEGEFKCGQLSTTDLKLLMHKLVQFQGVSVPLKDLIAIQHLKKLPLKQIEAFTCMGQTLNPPEIYLPRNLSRRDYLKKKAQIKLQHFIVFDENEYMSRSEGSVPVHLVEKDNQTSELIWKKSSHSVQPLRYYINETKKTQIKDKDFTAFASQINIISDVPGMGKSIFLDKLTCELKVDHKNYWIQKFELQAFIDEFQKFIDESIGESDASEVLRFFINQFLKFESDSVELTIIANLFMSGKVILCYDGFDEIGEEHMEVLLKIIAVLRSFSTENKFYITTRPERAQHLENRFNEFSFFLEPFTFNDQQNFLLKLWKKDSTWINVAGEIFKKLKKSIKDREKAFAEIPLTIRLVAEYFKEKIENVNEFRDYLASDLSFYKLMEYSVNRKFDIYFAEKLKINKNHPAVKKQMKQLKLDHTKLAMQLVFSQSNLDISCNLEKIDIDEFVRCGLVQLVNKKLKFIHQTVAEYLATLYLMENFGDQNILNFLFKVVLAKSGCEMMRSLINFVIKDTVNGQNRDFLGHLIQENSFVLFSAAGESNFNTFEVFFNILYETIDRKSLIKLLSIVHKGGSNLLHRLFLECKIINTEILDKILHKIESNSMKKLLRSRNIDDETIFLAAGRHGTNYVLLSKWILQKFADDYEFILEIFLKKDKSTYNILYKVAKGIHTESFIDFLGALKSFDNEHKKNLSMKLLFEPIFADDFMNHLVSVNSQRKLDSDIEAAMVDLFIKLLDWRILEHTSLFEMFIQSGTIPVLHEVARHYKRNLIRFMKYLLNRIEPNKLPQFKEFFSRTIFYVLPGEVNCNLMEIFIATVELLQEKFRDFKIKDFMKENCWNFWFFVFRCESSKIICEVLEWIKEKDLNLFYNMITNSIPGYQTNALHLICLCVEPLTNIPQIFKNIINMMIDNFPEFNLESFLNGKDFRQQTFLHILFRRYPYVEVEMAEVTCEILQWLSENHFDLIKEIIFSKDIEDSYFLHYLGGNSNVDYLPAIFKMIIQFLSETLPDFDLVGYLNSRNKKGETCLDCIKIDFGQEELIMVKNVIRNWLKSIGYENIE